MSAISLRKLLNHITPLKKISKHFLDLTFIEDGGSADLSDGAFQLEAEWVTVTGVNTGGTSSVMLQLHHVEVWGTALSTRTSRNTKQTHTSKPLPQLLSFYIRKTNFCSSIKIQINSTIEKGLIFFCLSEEIICNMKMKRWINSSMSPVTGN